MKYVIGAATNEGWGGRGNDASYHPTTGSGQYTAGVNTAPPAPLNRRKHGQKRYAPGTTASAVGPYSQGQTIERVT